MCCNVFAFAKYIEEKFTTDGCLLYMNNVDIIFTLKCDSDPLTVGITSTRDIDYHRVASHRPVEFRNVILQLRLLALRSNV